MPSPTAARATRGFRRSPARSEKTALGIGDRLVERMVSRARVDRLYDNDSVTVSTLLLAGASVLLGLGLSIFVNPIPRPAWFKGSHLTVLVVVALGAGVLAMLLNKAADELPAGAPPPDGAVTAVELAPDLRDRIVLSTDDSAGSYLLFASRLDGTNRRRIADWGGPITAIPKSTNIVVSRYVERSGHGRIEIRTITGDLVRALTKPPVGYGDDSASYAVDTGYVYFIRTKWNRADEQTSTAGSSVVMRVRIDGSAAAEEVRVGQELRTVSVDDSGRVIAGTCDDPSHVGQACLVSADGDGFAYIPGSEGTTLSDVQVSPDGRYVAYSSFAKNPFGESQIFLYDLHSKKTIDASRLDGLNSQPSWVRGSNNPCLLFTHDLSGSDPSVHLACMRGDWQTAKILPIGQYPELIQP
ncbi:hypothetical protein [Micromonospora sp. C95]|uniref:hypothetical protein n=1 Tax=Micromonospora sp. C95 TaxID=2824882 RepID=UPI001B386D49|nr:hypothetical protein [Micromonospora sp. C95]MBQ1022772.1 hypothetical protein [Micromonospora sp. C95]